MSVEDLAGSEKTNKGFLAGDQSDFPAVSDQGATDDRPVSGDGSLPAAAPADPYAAYRSLGPRTFDRNTTDGITAPLPVTVGALPVLDLSANVAINSKTTDVPLIPAAFSVTNKTSTGSDEWLIRQAKVDAPPPESVTRTSNVGQAPLDGPVPTTAVTRTSATGNGSDVGYVDPLKPVPKLSSDPIGDLATSSPRTTTGGVVPTPGLTPQQLWGPRVPTTDVSRTLGSGLGVSSDAQLQSKFAAMTAVTSFTPDVLAKLRYPSVKPPEAAKVTPVVVPPAAGPLVKPMQPVVNYQDVIQAPDGKRVSTSGIVNANVGDALGVTQPTQSGAILVPPSATTRVADRQPVEKGPASESTTYQQSLVNRYNGDVSAPIRHADSGNPLVPGASERRDAFPLVTQQPPAGVQSILPEIYNSGPRQPVIPPQIRDGVTVEQTEAARRKSATSLSPEEQRLAATTAGVGQITKAVTQVATTVVSEKDPVTGPKSKDAALQLGTSATAVALGQFPKAEITKAEIAKPVKAPQPDSASIGRVGRDGAIPPVSIKNLGVGPATGGELVIKGATKNPIGRSDTTLTVGKATAPSILDAHITAPKGGAIKAALVQPEGNLVPVKSGKQSADKGVGAVDKPEVPATRGVKGVAINPAGDKVSDGKVISGKTGMVTKAGDDKPGTVQVNGVKITRKLGGESAEADAIKPGKSAAVKVAGEKSDATTAAGKPGGAKIGSANIAGTKFGGEQPAAGKAEGRAITGGKSGAGKIISEIAEGKVVPGSRIGGAKAGIVDNKSEGKVVTGAKIGAAKAGVDNKVEGKAITGAKIGAAKAGVDNKVEGKAITGAKIGAAKAGVDNKVEGKAITGAKIGAAKAVVDNKVEGKAITGAKIGAAKAVVDNKVEGKVITGAKIGAAKAAVDNKVEGKVITGAKIGAAKVGVDNKVEGKAVEGKAVAGAKVGAIKAGVEKAEAKVGTVKTGGAVKSESDRNAAVKCVNSGSANATGNKVEVAESKGAKFTSKNSGIISAEAGRGDAKAVKAARANSVSAAGSEKVVTAQPIKVRTSEAIAKIFGLPLGTDKAGMPITADKGALGGKALSTREEANKAVKADHAKGIAKQDDVQARRIVGNAALNVDPAAKATGDAASADTDDISTTNKDAKDSKHKGSREAQLASKLNWMMQIAEAGLNFGDRRAVKVTGSREAASSLFRQAGRRRRRYIVKYGDNIRSIAREQLGDERYAQLLITINRGSAGFNMLPDNKTPHLLVDQVIWLPSDVEVETHKKHFFAKGTTAGEQQFAPAISVSPQAITRPEVEMEKVNLPEVEFMPSDSTEAYFEPDVSYEYDQHEVASFLQRLRNAGDRQAITLQEFESRCQMPSERRVYRVRLGDTLRSIALRDLLMQDQSMWPLIARINGISELRDGTGRPTVTLTRGNTIYLPSEEEVKQYRLMNRLAAHANSATQCTAETDLLSSESHSERDSQPSIEKLSHSCRINSSVSQGADAYVSNLEMQIAGEWFTVATYDYRHGHAYRYIHRKNGNVAAFPMDLPLEIVREMSHEDFARNWATYCIDFATASSDALSKSS